jgi:hypothetical protein
MAKKFCQVSKNNHSLLTTVSCARSHSPVLSAVTFATHGAVGYGSFLGRTWPTAKSQPPRITVERRYYRLLRDPRSALRWAASLSGSDSMA